MCTLVWLHQKDSLTLWHSRDERRSRGTAIPPVVEHRNHVSWISPRDSDSGGTWVGVNTHGVAVGIANLFTPAASAPILRKVSRGLLVQELLDSPRSVQVSRRVRALDLSPFDPFTLVSLEPGEPPVLFRWDRSALASVEPVGPALLVTSAGGSREIEMSRAGLFQRDSLSAEEIEALYRTRGGEPSFGVCVHTPEVSTVSLTRIAVTPSQVSLTYTAGHPCETAAGPTIVLDRIGLKAW